MPGIAMLESKKESRIDYKEPLSSYAHWAKTYNTYENKTKEMTHTHTK